MDKSIFFRPLFVVNKWNTDSIKCHGCFVENTPTSDQSEYMLTGLVRGHSDGVEVIRMFNRVFDAENQMESYSEDYDSCGVNLVQYSISGVCQKDLDHYGIKASAIDDETYVIIIGSTSIKNYNLKYLWELTLRHYSITADMVLLARAYEGL